MPLPVLVVDRDAAVQEGGQLARRQRLPDVDREQRLGLVEQKAAVAVGAGDQRITGLGGEGERAFEVLRLVEQLAQRLRIEDAKRRLERTDGAVDEISWRVGYEDPAFFRRLFKRTTGMAPGAYRKRFRIPDFARG